MLLQGAVVLMPLFSFMRFSRNWEKGSDFIPERFLDKDAEIARKLQHSGASTLPATQPPGDEDSTERTDGPLETTSIER
jgi:hypothetical protein